MEKKESFRYRDIELRIFREIYLLRSSYLLILCVNCPTPAEYEKNFPKEITHHTLRSWGFKKMLGFSRQMLTQWGFHLFGLRIDRILIPYGHWMPTEMRMEINLSIIDWWQRCQTFRSLAYKNEMGPSSKYPGPIRWILLNFLKMIVCASSWKSICKILWSLSAFR